MFCQGCGNQIPDNTPFCPNCGTPTGAGQAPVENQAFNQAGQPQLQNGLPITPASTGTTGNYKGLGIAGMVCGIVGVVFCWIWVGLVCGIVGLILSGVSVYKAQGRPNGMGIAGLVCSIVAVGAFILACACIAGTSYSAYNALTRW